MQRKLIAMILALALCLLLCACGSVRMQNGTAYDRSGDNAADYGTDMMPDPEDGYVDERNADNGLVGTTPAPSPRATHNP